MPRRRFFTLKTELVSLVLLLLQFEQITGYVKESDLFPFFEDSGSKRFYFGDDDHTEISLQTDFKFLNLFYSSAHINGNGIITFGKGSSAYRHECDAHASSILSVFMADADNRVDRINAKLLHRQDKRSASLQKISRDVETAFPSMKGIQLDWMLIVTWYKIPERQGNRRNTFQAILTRNDAHSFAIFYYNNITWPVDSTAEMGIFGGIANFEQTYVIPGSCNTSLINIAGMSNIDQPGKFVFKVDSTIEHPNVSKCISSSDTRLINVQLKPNIVSTPVNLPLLVHGLDICVESEVSSVTCIFHDVNRLNPQEIEGHVMKGQVAMICPTPEFYSLGRMKLDIRIKFSDNNTVSAYGFIYVVKEAKEEEEGGGVEGDWFVEPPQIKTTSDGGITLTASLNDNTTIGKLATTRMKGIDHFVQTNINELYPILDDEMVENWNFIHLRLIELLDSRWVITFPFPSFISLANMSTWTGESISESVLSILVSDKLDIPPRNVMVFNLVSTVHVGPLYTLYPAADVILTTLTLARLKVNGNSTTTANIFDRKCMEWYEREPATQPNDTLPCPPTLAQVLFDWRFSKDITSTTTAASTIMNPQNYTIFLQSLPSPSGAGSQCSYDSFGELVIGYPHASRMHRQSPNNWRDLSSHYWDDVMPYLKCCELSINKVDNCKQYFFSKRPSSNIGSGYVSTVPFRATGATHVTTLDGSTYMICALGTFSLLKYEDQLEIQILMEPYYSDSNTTTNSSTIITSAVIKSVTENNTAIFQVSANMSNGLLIWLDGEPINFYEDKIFGTKNDYLKDNFTLYHEGVQVLVSGTSQALFSFSSGFSVLMTLGAGNKSVNIIGSAAAEKCWGKVRDSLLGNFDGNPDNDLYTQSGNLFSTNSTVEKISKEFVEQWRLPENESLFQFPAGVTYAIYNNNNYSVNASQINRHDLINLAPDHVKTICGNVEDCLIDYQLTGNLDYAKSSIFSYQQFERLVNMSKVRFDPITCENPETIPNGKYVGDSFNLGAIITPTCESGHYLNAVNINTNASLQEISFTCLMNEDNDDVELSRVNKSTNHVKQFPTWISQSFQLLTDFKVECVSLNQLDRDLMKSVNKVVATPNVVSVLGNESISLSFSGQIDTKDVVSVTCAFYSMDQGIVMETQGSLGKKGQTIPVVVNCPVPILNNLGRINIKLVIRYLNKLPVLLEGHLWSQQPSEDLMTRQLKLSFERDDDFVPQVILSWNPSVFGIAYDYCDISLILLQKSKSDKFWIEVAQVAPEICNTGSFNLTTSSILESLLKNTPTTLFHDIYVTPTLLALKSQQKSGGDTEMMSQLATAGLLQSIEMLYKVMNTSGGHHQLSNELSSGENEKSVGMPHFDSLCKHWYDNENDDDGCAISSKHLLPCPTSASLAQIDWRFIPLASFFSFIQRIPSPESNGAGAQCEYDSTGKLVTEAPSGSQVHRFNPNNWDNDWWDHYTHDILPYLYCCQWGQSKEDNCPTYFYKKRKIPSNGQGYKLPRFAHVWGAGHIHTFDGLSYRFNGAGEFWLMKHEDHRMPAWINANRFDCQVRLEPYATKAAKEEEDVHKMANNVSVITAMSMQQVISGNMVTIQVARNLSSDFNVLVNGELVDSNELNVAYQKGANIFFDRNESQVLVVFQNGFSFNFTISGLGEPGMNVIISAAVQNYIDSETEGLLGTMDGVKDNDFATPSWSVLPANSSTETVHLQFGLQWLVSQNESIFSYYPWGTSYQDYFKPDFVPIQQIPDQHGATFCEDDFQCIFDATTTGSDVFARASRVAQDVFKKYLILSNDILKVRECPRLSHKYEGSWSKGSIIQVNCVMGTATTAVGFTCSENAHSGVLEWISMGNYHLSLDSCLLSKQDDDVAKNLHEVSGADLHNSHKTAVIIIISIFMLVLLFVVSIFLFVRFRHSNLSTRRFMPSFSMSLLESDEIDQ